jgi:hypothetical protein
MGEFMTQPTTPLANPPGQRPLVLFQYGAVHEELAPPLLTACNTLGHKISISLHSGSLRDKGDVFHAFSEDCLAGHHISYRPGGLKESGPGQQLEALIKPLENPCVFFLTLQNPWTVQIARSLQSKGIRVYGIVHNVNKVRGNPEVLSFWREHSATPVVLSPHVRVNLATCLNLRPEDIGLLYSTFQPDGSALGVNQQNCLVTRIAISGAINYSSRPFETLLKTMVSLKRQRPQVSAQLVFHLLGGGPDRNRLIREVAACFLSDNFHFADVNKDNGRSTYSEYYGELSKCHYMLALDVDRYTAEKITSTVPTSVSFLRPLIATSRFFTTYELSGAGLISDNLESALSHAASKFEFSRHIERLQQIRAKQLQHNAAFVHGILSPPASTKHSEMYFVAA